jgi:hypothetical protein
MGILTRAPDTPAKAVAWFVRHDVDPDVSDLRGERARLVAGLDELWLERSKAERYESIRRARLAARALEVQGGPIARRLRAAAAVLEFMWEREYGTPVAGFADSWPTLAVAEMATVAAIFSD